MQISLKILNQITGNTSYVTRKSDFARIINEYGDLAPHQIAQLLAQVLHESAGFRYAKELWGPTKAQRGYEGRRDLGNTMAGDGYRYMGRDVIQITGRSNYCALTDWAQAKFGGSIPDFEAEPNELLKFVGLGALWYWSVRVPAKYVDAGNIEMVTRRVNGGLNGYSDRLLRYDRAALVLLGLSATDVRGFQVGHNLVVDGVSGPATRAALHKALVALSDDAPRIFKAPNIHEQPETYTPPEQPVTGFMAMLAAFLKGWKR